MSLFPRYCWGIRTYIGKGCRRVIKWVSIESYGLRELRSEARTQGRLIPVELEGFRSFGRWIGNWVAVSHRVKGFCLGLGDDSRQPYDVLCCALERRNQWETRLELSDSADQGYILNNPIWCHGNKVMDVGDQWEIGSEDFPIDKRLDRRINGPITHRYLAYHFV